MFIQDTFTLVTSRGRGFYELTTQINQTIAKFNITIGMCNVFLHHTSASLVLCENDDPKVKHDLEVFMQKWAPDGKDYTHQEEGPDDMPAHIRSILTQNSLNIPISDKILMLGRWQSVYLWEHRLASHERKITLSFYH